MHAGKLAKAEKRLEEEVMPVSKFLFSLLTLFCQHHHDYHHNCLCVHHNWHGLDDQSIYCTGESGGWVLHRDHIAPSLHLHVISILFLVSRPTRRSLWVFVSLLVYILQPRQQWNIAIPPSHPPSKIIVIRKFDLQLDIIEKSKQDGRPKLSLTDHQRRGWSWKESTNKG